MFSFTALQADLNRAVKLCLGVIERKCNVPILLNLRARWVAGNIVLTASDMDMEISVIVPANGQPDTDGITFPAHTFGSIVSKATDDNIAVRVKEDKALVLAITAGKAKFTLGTLPAEDFPTFSVTENVISDIDIEAHDLVELIDSTRHAVSKEVTRYYLNGIFLHQHEENLRAVATDGHRLARVDTPVNEGVNDDTPAVIVPTKAALHVLSMLEGITGPVRVQLSKAHATFILTSAGITFSTKLVDGQYPDYARIVPTNNDKFCLVEKSVLVAALDRVSTVTSKSGAVKLAFKKDACTIYSGNASDTSQAEEEIDVQWAHPPFTIGFNAGYLLSALARMTDHVQLNFGRPEDPAILRGIINEQPTPEAMNLIMPLRVN